MNWPTSFLRRWYSKTPSARLPLRVLGLESLEDRTTPTVITSVGTFNVAENTTAAITVTTDVTATYSISGGTDGALFGIDGTTGDLTFLAAPDFEALASAAGTNVYLVDVLADDGFGNTDTQAITVTVTDVNEAPTAVALSNASLAENAGANASVGALSTTDVDAGDTFTYTLVSGTGDTDNALFNISGSQLRATASFDFEAGSSYTVRVRSTDAGGLFTEQDFAVTVTNVNEAPTALALSNASVAENAGANAPVGALSTTDVDAGDTFTYTLVSGTGDTDNALFNISGSQLRATASFDFEAGSSYTVRVRSTDAGGLFTEQDFAVTVTNVNEAPTALALSNASVAENAGANAPVGALSTTDVDAGDTFTYTLVSGTGDTDNALFNISGSQLRATASFDFEAGSSYTVRVRSTDAGGLFTEQDFAVTVTNVNEAPVNTVPGTVTVAPSSTTSLPGISAADVDAAAGNVTVTVSVAGGSGTFTGTGFTGGSGSNAISITGTLSAANAALATLQYTAPATGASVTVTVLTSDGGNTGVGGTLTDTDTFTVTVTTNQAPVNTVGPSVSTNEDTPFVFTGVNAISVADPDNTVGNITTVVTVPVGRGSVTATGATGSGTNAVTIVGTAVAVNAALATLVYSPPLNGNSTTFGGAVVLTVSTTDALGGNDTDTVTITVTPVNDAPAAVADAFSGAEDAASITGNVVTNDTDAENDARTVSAVNGSALNVGSAVAITGGTVTVNANGSFTFAPALNYNGPATFTYTANDGTADSATDATVTITVTPVNDAPVAVADTYTTTEDTPRVVSTPGVLANDTDADLDTLTAVLVAGPSHGTVTVNTNGSFTYTPTANYNGPDSFTYKANDGTADSNTVTVTLTVTAVNDPPAITSNGGLATAAANFAENGTGAVTTVAATDTDLPAQTLTYSISGGADAALFGIDSSTGALTFLAAPDFEAPTDADGDNSYLVQVQVSDGTLTDTQALSVTVTDDVPGVALAASDPSASERGADESADPGRFALTRTGDLSGPLTVNYTLDGTALNGRDYQALAGAVTFAPGSATAFIDVFVLNNLLIDGTRTVGVTLVPGANYSLTASATAAATIADNDRVFSRFATGSSSGGVVAVFDNGSQTPTAVLTPFPGFAGGLAVAVGDVNGDGIKDVAVAVAAGGPSFVQVLDGATGAVRLSFMVMDAGYLGGCSIALGDVDGDGRAEIIIGLLAGLPAVGVFDGLTGTLRTAFLAYPEAPAGLIGVHVATGDLDGDGRAEIVTTPTGVAPLVRAFDMNGTMVRNFFAFDPAIAAVGATVATGDLNGDGRAEILVGASALGGNFLLTFNGDTTLRAALPLPVTNPPTAISGFGPPVGAADLNGDGADDVLVTVGPSLSGLDGRTLSVFGDFLPFSGFAGGVYVG